MGNREIFASRLREIRQQTGKTQKEFADMVMSTAATISAYENSTKNPSLDIVMNIAEKCNVSIDWLCGLSEEKGLKPEIKTYKDIAVRILELLELEIEPFDSFYWKAEKENDFVVQLIGLPHNDELFKFMETYDELKKLLNSNKIKQHVIDTWLDGALEELAAIPILTEIPYEEPDDSPQS